LGALRRDCPGQPAPEHKACASRAIEAYRKTLELQPELYEAKERLDALLSGRVLPFAKSENQAAPLKM
jgi:hypothetical protein